MSKRINEKNNNLAKAQNVNNHITHHGSGSVHLNNYLEDENENENYNFSQDSDYLPPLPFQEHNYKQNHYKHYTDSDSASNDSETSNEADTEGTNTPIREQIFKKSPGLQKRFSVPFKKAPPVITPQSKTTSFSTDKDITTDTASVNIPNPIEEVATTNDASNGKNAYKGKVREETFVIDKNKERITDDNEVAPTAVNLPKGTTSSVYKSPYLHNVFKPEPESLNLSPELEPLTPLLLSQHEAFTERIKDLGSIYLNATKSLEKKKNNFHLLKNNKKIPRSLRIKCELTTSPNFSNDKTFLTLKDELHQIIETCINDGTTTITNWAERNIELLTLERCVDYLRKALQILEGLASFFADIISYPSWPSANDKNLTLFMLKAYLSSKYIEASKLTEYLEMPPDKILLSGAKILLDTDSNETAEHTLASLKLSDINFENETEEIFVTEVLTAFNQIITFTTAKLWHCYSEASRQTAAGLKLKSKMKAMDIINATLATAQALEKASDHVNTQKAASLETGLRISNLEKFTRTQEQKTNEILKKFKTNTNHRQKNLKGSHPTESMTSPKKQTPPNKKQKSKRNMVDLTIDDDEESNSPPQTKNKKQRPTPQKTKEISQPQNQKQKTVQWRETEKVKIFHPSQPVSRSFIKQASNNPFIPNDNHSKLAFFPHAFPPPPPPHYVTQPHVPSQFYHTQTTVPNAYQPQYQIGNMAPSQNPFVTPGSTHAHVQFHNPAHNQPNPSTYPNPFGTFPNTPSFHANKN